MGERSPDKIGLIGEALRAMVVFAMGLIPAAAQGAFVHLANLSRPFSSEFQVGDRFEIQITGAPGQAISVRTSRQGRTDWGPVVAYTDNTGRWSTAGQFDKSDFGYWSEIWTVGGTLATPAVQFNVKAPCGPGGQSQMFMSGPNVAVSCDTAQGRDRFVTPSFSDSFRTPDGRLVPGRPEKQTAEEYQMGILTDLISSAGTDSDRISLFSSSGGLGDETGDLISRLIGVNALDENETKNVLVLIRSAFQRPERIAPSAVKPVKTLMFLQNLLERAGEESVREQIASTIAYLRTL